MGIKHSYKHYKSKIDVIDFCAENKIGFTVGNILKYLTRAGKKENTPEREDLEKATRYLFIHLFERGWCFEDIRELLDDVKARNGDMRHVKVSGDPLPSHVTELLSEVENEPQSDKVYEIEGVTATAGVNIVTFNVDKGCEEYMWINVDREELNEAADHVDKPGICIHCGNTLQSIEIKGVNFAVAFCCVLERDGWMYGIETETTQGHTDSDFYTVFKEQEKRELLKLKDIVLDNWLKSWTKNTVDVIVVGDKCVLFRKTTSEHLYTLTENCFTPNEFGYSQVDCDRCGNDHHVVYIAQWDLSVCIRCDYNDRNHAIAVNTRLRGDK